VVSVIATSLAVDATTLFYVDSFGNIQSVPNSGSVNPTALTVNGGVGALVIDATKIYFTMTSSGTVHSIHKDGSQDTVLALGQVGPSAIAVDGLNVYWGNSDGSIRRAPIAGGTAHNIAMSQPLHLEVDSSSVYWSTGSALLKTVK
jgi:hypothetical protein